MPVVEARSPSGKLIELTEVNLTKRFGIEPQY